jgi:hypothetical protein
MRSNHRQWLCVVLPLFVLIGGVAPALAGQVQLAWDAPTNTDSILITTLAGYHLDYWQARDGVLHSVDVGDQTTYTLDGLVDGATYSFAVTDYDTDGNESSASNIVTGTIPSGPTLVSPPPPSTLPGAMGTFTWSNGGLPVAEWWLSVGTSAGANDLFDSGSLGSALSMTIDGFPTDGETIFVRLWYMLDGIWQYSDSQYTAAPTP